MPTKKKMRRVYAQGYITAMKNKHSVRDRTDMNLPRNTMRPHHAQFTIGSANSDVSVSKTATGPTLQGTDPNPTTAWLDGHIFLVEPFLNSAPSTHHADLISGRNARTAEPDSARCISCRSP